MAQSCCPVHDCTNPIPENGFICAEHHFEIPREDYALIVRMRFDAQRASDPKMKKYYQTQFQGYLNSACNKIATTRHGVNNG